MHFDDVVDRLAQLPDPLPQPAAALMPILLDGTERQPPRVAPAGRPGRPASVLALVVPGEDRDARIVLIERTAHDGHHSGEVSFPGGKAEPGDTDEVATALREAAEEVGLDPVAAGVRIVGRLDRVWIPISDFEVTPIVAVARVRPALVPDPREVARILAPPLAQFLPAAPIEIVERTVRDWPLRYGAFAVDGLSVWGATARILGQLGAVVA